MFLSPLVERFSWLMKRESKILAFPGICARGVGRKVPSSMSQSRSSLLDISNFLVFVAVEWVPCGSKFGLEATICSVFRPLLVMSLSDVDFGKLGLTQGLTEVELNILQPRHVWTSSVSPSILTKICFPSHCFFFVL